MMTCDVCSTIIEVCSAGFDEHDEEILGLVSTVLSQDCPHAESLPRAAAFGQPLEDFPDRLLAVKKTAGGSGLRLCLVKEETPEGSLLYDQVSITFADLASPPDTDGYRGRAVLPDAHWISLDTVHEWVSRCLHQHGAQCREPAWLEGVRIARPEWLIDTLRDCIVPVPESGETRYVALSYTWGLGRNVKTVKAALHELQQPGALKSPLYATQLPETIRNAMDLVKAAGETYLWVDALCIVQDDAESLRRNLDKMNLIYAGAVFCIVAAAGQGAEYGLRGIRGISEPRNVELDVYPLAEGYSLIEKPINPHITTEYSYHQRGWTFQEWLSSRRRLVFGDRLLEWHCQCAKWTEYLRILPEEDENWALSASQRQLMKLVPSVWEYADMMTTFNTKSLTMQEDAPRAFAGIQAMLHRVHPGGLIYGLSEFFFEVHLAWTSETGDIKRRTVSPVSGARPLPSWSWLGWQGRVNFPFDAEFRLVPPWLAQDQKVGFREPVTEWLSTDSPRSADARKIQVGWHQAKVNAVDSSAVFRGWSREPYEKEAYPYDYFQTGHIPVGLFAHESDPEQRFKYSVPVLSWADEPVLSPQDAFLRFTTTRVSTNLIGTISVSQDDMFPRRIRITERDTTFLSLALPDLQIAQEIQQDVTSLGVVELVAFAKGWSTWLGDGTYIGETQDWT